MEKDTGKVREFCLQKSGNPGHIDVNIRCLNRY